jgi:hypothetical protein
MNSKLRLILVMLCIGLTSCDTQVPVRQAPPLNQTWIDAPLHGSTIPMELYTIVYHGASPSGIDLFQVRIDGIVLDESGPSSTGPSGSYGTLFMGDSDWLPWAPGTYMISVRAMSTGGSFGPYAYAEVTVSDKFELLESTPPAILTLPPTVGLPPSPTLTPSPTPTPTQGVCIYTAVANLFCRTGPGGSLYPAVDSLVPGQSSPVLGLSPDGFFAQIDGVNNLQACYVPLGERYGVMEGACDNLSTLIPPPPPPTETPPSVGCTQRQAGGDIICVYPCPNRAAPGEACTMP